jgi:hypothetical protein
MAVIAGMTTTVVPKNHSLRLLKIFIRACPSSKLVERVEAMIDGACSRTIIDEETARDLGCWIQLVTESLISLHGKKDSLGSDVNFQISRDGETWFNVKDALTYRAMKIAGSEFNWNEFKTAHPKFKRVDVDDVSFDRVKILLGADLEELWLPLEGSRRWIREAGVLAYRTKLGWTIGGKQITADSTSYCNLTIGGGPTNEYFERLAIEMKRFNDLEALGVESKKTKLSRQAEKQKQQLDETTEYDGCGGVKSHNFEPKEDPWLGGRTDCGNELNGAVPKLQKCPEA